ncbi:MAG: DUF1592 domain-containing protein [Chthonomonadales bacterium]|nr:DUF1592 domain-containing protein [Chthonomonadales bacterium]
MPGRGRLLLTSSALLPAALLCVAAANPAPRKPAPKPSAAVEAAFRRDVAPIVRKLCAPCHSGKTPAAGLDLAAYPSAAAVLRARDVWDRVAANVASAHMPPAGMPQPSVEQRRAFVAWVQSALSSVDCDVRDPGHVTLRRLNRAEYNNTVRDLLGVSIRPADSFPSDDVGYGFDNIGDVLSISPLLLEKHLAAAGQAARAAVVAPEDCVVSLRLEAEKLPQAPGASSPGEIGQVLYTQGEIGGDVDLPVGGPYRVRVRAYGQQAGPDPARMAVKVDGKPAGAFDVKATESGPAIYEARVRLAPGRHRLSASFLNDFYNPSAAPNSRDRNLAIDYLEAVGPEGGAPGAVPESQKRILRGEPRGADVAAAARRVLAPLAARAYRRPATREEVTGLARLVALARKQGDSFERGIQVAIQAMLVSPGFLFHVEADPRPTSATARPLDAWELASRLSYFLWSSMPDERLFRLAADGTLRKPAVLAAEARRMLGDPRARALSDNFAAQWLELRNLETAAPDPVRFPAFTDALRRAMREETERYFMGVVANDRSVLEFLDSRYTYLNEPLARHYGIAGVKGTRFRKVALSSGRRGGVITQASVLTVTSNPTRTSPVKRGKWILEEILGTPPPPQPANVGQLPDDRQGPLVGTLRQRMEQHRKDPACAGCHARMDPLGFGLENFDAVGAWRARDGGQPIDSSGVLPDGRRFRGPAELRQILMGRKDQFVKTLVEKLLTYGLGRGLESYDRCAVDDIVRTARRGGYRFSALVAGIVRSDPFTRKRGDGGTS